MSKIERSFKGDFEYYLIKIENGMLNTEVPTSIAEISDFTSGDSRCSVRVFEHCGYKGLNNISMNVTMFQGADGMIQLSAVTSGGIDVAVKKFNIYNEDIFLDKIIEIVDK